MLSACDAVYVGSVAVCVYLCMCVCAYVCVYVRVRSLPPLQSEN